jgi:hypothetical protein
MDDGAKSSISKESHPSKNEEEDDDNQEEEKLMNYSSPGILSWSAALSYTRCLLSSSGEQLPLSE